MKFKTIIIHSFWVFFVFSGLIQGMEKNNSTLQTLSESPSKSKLDNFDEIIEKFYEHEPLIISPKKTYLGHTQESTPLSVQSMRVNTDEQNDLTPHSDFYTTTRKRKRKNYIAGANKARRILEYDSSEIASYTPEIDYHYTYPHPDSEYYVSSTPEAIPNMPQAAQSYTQYSSLINPTSNTFDYTGYLNTPVSDPDQTLLATYLQPRPPIPVQETDISLPPIGDTNNKSYIDQLIEIRKTNHPKICCTQKHISWQALIDHIRVKHTSICGFSCPEVGCNQHNNSRPNLLAEMYATHAQNNFLSCPRCNKDQSAGSLKNHFLKCGIIKNEIKTPKPMFQSFKMYQPK